MDNKQKLNPDLKEIYERVMKTPVTATFVKQAPNVSVTPQPTNVQKPPQPVVPSPQVPGPINTNKSVSQTPSPNNPSQNSFPLPKSDTQNIIPDNIALAKAKTPETHPVEKTPEPPFFTLKTAETGSSFKSQDLNSRPIEEFHTSVINPQVQNTTNPIQLPPIPTTFSSAVNTPPIPNPVVARAKPKGSKVWGFLMTLFFIFYTIFWLIYFKVVDKSLLDLLTGKLGIKIM